VRQRVKTIATLELGSSKVVITVADVGPEGISVRGVGVAPANDCLREGNIVNLAGLVQAINTAKLEAENMAGYTIGDVYASVSGSHVYGVTSSAMTNLKHGKVLNSDVRDVLSNATVISLPPNQRVVDIYPLSYSVDGIQNIDNPMEMSGKRLDVNAHLVTASGGAIDNISKCAARAGLRVVKTVSSALASALAVLHDEEREIGAAVLDFGAGLCELTIWEKQGLVYTAVIPVGGHNITEDIAAGLSTPIAVAEELKVTQGHAYNTSYTNGTTIQVRGAGGRGTYNYHINNLYMIIEVRFIEIFSHVRSQLANYGINDSLPGGLVLTGGASKMPGLIDAADEALNMSVRIGIPRDVKELSTILNDPAMATSYGLLVCASMRYNTEIPRAKLPGGPPQQRGLLKEIVRKVKGFTI